MRPAARVAALVVLTLALGGCGLNPPDGVRVDRRIAEAQDEPDVRRLPSGPRPGDAPEDIVRGFLGAAAADPTGGHDYARAFLSSDAIWDDRAGAGIYAPDSLTLRLLGRDQIPAATDGGPTSGTTGSGTTTGDTATVQLTADRLGTLAADGSFLPAAGRIRLDLRLARTDQEWRIVRPPSGLLLSPRDLARGYRPVSRFFLAADRDLLVADPVYVPGTRATAPGAAVRALLDGPSSWLAPAVRTAIPVDLTTAGSVVVAGGTAAVDLDAAAFDVPLDRRPVVVGQLAATLASVPGVETVRVTVEGRPYQEGEPPVPAAAPAALETVVDGPTYALAADGQLRRVVGPADEGPTGVVDVPGAPDGLVAAVPDPGGSGTLAVRQRAGGGTRLLIGPLGGLRVAAVPAGELVGPSWVPGRGAVVARTRDTGAAGRTDLEIVAPSGSAQPLADVTGLGDVRELAVSPDGARIAVRTGPLHPEREPRARSTLWLGRLGRDGGRLHAGGFVAVASGVDSSARPSWSGPTSLTVTGRRGDSPAGLWRILTDRLADPERIPTEGLPGDVDALSAAPGRSLLAVVDGRLYRQGADRWSPIGAAAAVDQPH